MQIFDEVLDILNDGHYHTFKEILDKTHLNENQLEAVLNLLSEHNFIYIKTAYMGSTVPSRAKLTPPLERFLKRIRELDSLSETEAAIAKEESTE